MIEVHHQGGIATLTLARPTARNAFSIAGWEALAAAAQELAGSQARAVVLRSGEAAIFSSGADLSEMPLLQSDTAPRGRFRLAMRAGIDAVAALPMPVIAAVDGGCYGAAVALVLACDMRVAGRQAMFGVTPAKLGIGYPREDVARLRAQIGRGQAARLLFTGAAIDMGEAHRIGLVECKAAHAGAAALELAERIAANAPGAVRLLKRTLDGAGDTALDAAFEDAFGGDEFAIGLAAFHGRSVAEYP